MNKFERVLFSVSMVVMAIGVITMGIGAFKSGGNTNGRIKHIESSYLSSHSNLRDRNHEEHLKPHRHNGIGGKVISE